MLGLCLPVRRGAQEIVKSGVGHSCWSAQRACSATSGFGNAARRLERRAEFLQAAVAHGDRDVAQETRIFGALDRDWTRNMRAKFVFGQAASSSSGGAKWRGSKAGSCGNGAREFHGQTSWQISQPKMCWPMPARISSGAAPCSSMVK